MKTEDIARSIGQGRWAGRHQWHEGISNGGVDGREAGTYCEQAEGDGADELEDGDARRSHGCFFIWVQRCETEKEAIVDGWLEEIGS